MEPQRSLRSSQVVKMEPQRSLRSSQVVNIEPQRSLRSSQVMKMEPHQGEVVEEPGPSFTNTTLEPTNKRKKLDEVKGKLSPESSVSSVLINRDILKSVFEHLDEKTLKDLGPVCSTWSQEISSTLRHPVIELWESGYPAVIYDNLQKFPHLHRIEVCIGYGRHNELIELLETLQDGTASPPEGRIDVSRTCKSVLRFHINAGFGNIRIHTQFLLEIMRMATNLKELEIHALGANEEDSTAFFDAFLCPEAGWAVTDTFNQSLESLRIVNEYFDDQDVEKLRNLKLAKLKTLDLDILEDDLFCRALSLWVSDLKSSLESFSIQLAFSCAELPDMDFKFLTEMEVLKTLNVTKDVFSEGFIILPLLSVLPNLETLIVEALVSTGVSRKEYLSPTFKMLSYPCLKVLKIDFCEVSFTQLDCKLNEYIPKLFPNLKILQMPVDSKQNLLDSVIDLGEMRIEELYLTLINFEETETECEIEMDPDVFWDELNTPSFDSWPKLRKLTLKTPFNWSRRKDLTPTKLYNMPIENILPSHLTSLGLTFAEIHINHIHDRAKVELSFLLTLLQGLPRLMDCSLDYCNVVKDGNIMELSGIRDTIQSDPLLHPYLHFGGLQY